MDAATSIVYPVSNFALHWLPLCSIATLVFRYFWPIDSQRLLNKYDDYCVDRYFEAYTSNTSCQESDLDSCRYSDKCDLYDDWGDIISEDDWYSYSSCSYWDSWSSYYDTCCQNYECGGAYIYQQLAIAMFVFCGVGVVLELIRFIMALVLSCRSSLKNDCCPCAVNGQRPSSCTLDVISDSIFFKMVQLCNSKVYKECREQYRNRTFYTFANAFWITKLLIHDIPMYICGSILYFGYTGASDAHWSFWAVIVLDFSAYVTRIRYRSGYVKPMSVANAATVNPRTVVVQPQTRPQQQQHMPAQQQQVVYQAAQPQGQQPQTVMMIQLPNGQLVPMQQAQQPQSMVAQAQVQYGQPQYASAAVYTGSDASAPPPEAFGVQSAEGGRGGTQGGTAVYQ